MEKCKKKSDVLKNLCPKIWYEKGYAAWKKSLKKTKTKNIGHIGSARL